MKIINTLIFSELDGSSITYEYSNGVFKPLSGEVGEDYRAETIQESWDLLVADSHKLRDLKVLVNNNLPIDKVELVKDEEGNTVDKMPLVQYKTKIVDGKAVAVFASKDQEVADLLISKNISVIVE